MRTDCAKGAQSSILSYFRFGQTKRPEIDDEEIKDTAALVMDGLVKIISMAKK